MSPSRDSQQFLDEEHLLTEEEKDSVSAPVAISRRQPRSKLLTWSVVLNLVLAALLVASWSLSAWRSKKYWIPNEIYSPAQNVVEYKNVVFEAGLREDRTAYQGSSDEVNKRWDELYNFVGISAIPREMAIDLPNATTPTWYDSSKYYVELDVFHQLHCLNMMRQLVYPATFPQELDPDTEEGLYNVYHMEHCYDQMRQSIMCNADVGTIYWEWSEERQRMFGNMRTTHTCKDFDKIWQWADNHKATKSVDNLRYVPGAPKYTGPANDHPELDEEKWGPHEHHVASPTGH